MITSLAARPGYRDSSGHARPGAAPARSGCTNGPRSGSSARPPEITISAAGSDRAGNICIRNPWPGIMQTIWGQPDRFIDIYYRKYNQDPDSKDWRHWPYFAGDGALQAADGCFRILGRVDDVINVAGHRLGTKELESAALTVPEVAEAAAVPVVDDVRGRAVEMYVSLKPGGEESSETAAKVIKAIESGIGKIARPRNVWIVADMPKVERKEIETFGSE